MRRRVVLYVDGYGPNFANKLGECACLLHWTMRVNAFIRTPFHSCLPSSFLKTAINPNWGRWSRGYYGTRGLLVISMQTISTLLHVSKDMPTVLLYNYIGRGSRPKKELRTKRNNSHRPKKYFITTKLIF